MTAKQLRKLMADFDWKAWQDKLEPGFTQIYRDLIEKQGTAATDEHGGDDVEFDIDDPFVSSHMTDYVGDRMTQLSETSQDDVSDAIVRAFDNADADLSTSDLRDLVLDTVREKYDGYESWRALRIARTESAIGYNNAGVLGGIQSGFDKFDVTDGEDDEDCADANGAIWSGDHCLDDPLAHPNCTRVFSPNGDPDAEVDDD